MRKPTSGCLDCLLLWHEAGIKELHKDVKRIMEKDFKTSPGSSYDLSSSDCVDRKMGRPQK